MHESKTKTATLEVGELHGVQPAKEILIFKKSLGPRKEPRQ